jgi:hypothetical protein
MISTARHAALWAWTCDIVDARTTVTPHTRSETIRALIVEAWLPRVLMLADAA